MTTLVHGWACSKTIWPKSHASYFDRGYFNQPQPFQKNDVVVTHSFGLHFLPKEPCQHLIILSGFISFSSKKRIVLKMLQKFERQPDQVLRDFHELGKSSFELPKSFNKELLKEDLEWLAEADLDLKFLTNVPKINIFHGKNDQITPLEWGMELHKSLPQSTLHLCDGGHFETIIEACRKGFI